MQDRLYSTSWVVRTMWLDCSSSVITTSLRGLPTIWTRLRATITPSGGISPDVIVAACLFVTMFPRPMTRAFLKAVNGPASKRAIRISIPMHRNGNRLFPIRSVMPDGQETGCSNSTTPMTASNTPSTTTSPAMSSNVAASRPRKHTPTRFMSQRAGTMKKSFMRIYLTPTQWT